MEKVTDTVTLKEYFEKILAEKDKYYEKIIALAKESVQIAEAGAEKWRQNANEWRGAMTDREKNFLKQETFEAYKESVEKALAVQKERGDEKRGEEKGMSKVWGWITAGIVFIISVITFIMKFT